MMKSNYAIDQIVDESRQFWFGKHFLKKKSVRHTDTDCSYTFNSAVMTSLG